MASVREIATISARWFIFTGAGDEDRALGELRLLLHHGLGAGEAVQLIALDQRPVPVPGAPGHEHMDATERRAASRLSGGSPYSGRLSAMPIIGGAIWPPHLVVLP